MGEGALMQKINSAKGIFFGHYFWASNGRLLNIFSHTLGFPHSILNRRQPFFLIYTHFRA